MERVEGLTEIVSQDGKRIDPDAVPAIYLTKACEYCGYKYNLAYYPPFCDGCGASLETGSVHLTS